jgi:hypothetical protein
MLTYIALSQCYNVWKAEIGDEWDSSKSGSKWIQNLDCGKEYDPEDYIASVPLTGIRPNENRGNLWKFATIAKKDIQ